MSHVKTKEINNINNNAAKNLNNDFYIESSNKENYSNNYETEKKEEKENINNNLSNGNMGFSFLNDYTSFNEKEKEKEIINNNKNNKENIELIELKEKYEKTVNEILIEEKNCLDNHKSHIDNMVLTMKNEMNLINILEQKSNVDEYVDKILEIFGEQENKINQMKQKLLGFKRLLKEENELSQKISLLTEKEDNNDYIENNHNINYVNNYEEENNISLNEEE